MREQMMNTTTKMSLVGTHGHRYICKGLITGDVYTDDKLPRILKALRIATGYTFKIPHGNKVRTLILEEGICIITDNGVALYEITIERW